MEATVYYNPHCGTCRKVVENLQSRGFKTHLIEYLRTPPTEDELDKILRRMKAEPVAIVRTKEPLYEEKFAGKTLSRAQWLKALHENPILIQRPIVVIGEKAAVVRPPEALDAFLS